MTHQETRKTQTFANGRYDKEVKYVEEENRFCSKFCSNYWRIINSRDGWTLDVSFFQTLGGLLRTGRDLVNHVATTLAFVWAMFLFNCIFYQTKLVPRWLSVWGLIGSALSILASLLFIRFIGLDATYMILNISIAFQQLVLAIWLIIIGLNPTVQDPESL